MTKVNLDSIPQFYRRYVEQVHHLDMKEAIVWSGEEMQKVLQTIPENLGEYRYAPGKWNIKELLQHMMDAERIFAYRALRFSRADQTPLPGFEENDYAPRANAHSRTVEMLAMEMHRLRQTTIDLFESFSPEMLALEGTASNTRMSVLALGFIVPGHETHHRKVLLERYLA